MLAGSFAVYTHSLYATTLPDSNPYCSIKLVCIILDTCGKFFDHGKDKKRYGAVPKAVFLCLFLRGVNLLHLALPASTLPIGLTASFSTFSATFSESSSRCRWTLTSALAIRSSGFGRQGPFYFTPHWPPDPADSWTFSNAYFPGAISPDMPFAETLEDADKAVDEFESVQRKKLERRLGISDTVRRFFLFGLGMHTLFGHRTSSCCFLL